MKSRSGWTRGADGPIRLGKKTYRELIEFSRPCATCQKSFSIFVTRKIAEGLADSNNFGLKNCEEHRRGASSAEVAELRVKEGVMSDEVNGLYGTIRELTRQVETLKARLARYELQPAMEAKASKINDFPWK